ncbi:DUF3017 domain-containing protein [Mycobacterium tuberculosis]|uniref:DUF3017 domain-containing protein n=1 Tax=Mycobacterium tuberculosis TaxID=1773 RepID=UPI0009A0EECB
MTVRAVFRRTVGAQWPILLVGSIFAVGFVLAGANFWRRGALLIGIGVGVAAVLRLVLSEERAGLLGRPASPTQARSQGSAATAASAAPAQHPDHRLTAMLGTHGKGLAA